MEQSARRLSSLFSLRSNSSDRSNASAPSISQAKNLHVDTGSPPPILLRSPTTELRATASTPDLHTPVESTPLSAHPSASSSRPNSAIPGQDYSSLLNLKPLPLPTDERISRPSSRASSQGSSRHNSPSKQFKPLTPTEEERSTTPTLENRLGKRRSWLPSRQRGEIRNESPTAQMPAAWFVNSQEKAPYDATALASFSKVQELWNETGDTLIYLHSREHGRGPSFRVDSSCFAASRKLTAWTYGAPKSDQHRSASYSRDLQSSTTEDPMHRLTVDHARSPARSRTNSSPGDSPPSSLRMEAMVDVQQKDMHLCIPQPLQTDLTVPQPRFLTEDMDMLIAARNMFAFLLGQPLVATSHSPTLFAVLLKIAELLQRYHFTNLDGSTLGENVTQQFAKIVDQHRLCDVRASREKTIEAVVLGERMRYLPLYNEGFVHGVGKWDDLVQLNNPKLLLVTTTTRKRMERSTIDLGHRVATTRRRLNDMDFQTVFAGFANSSSSAESKIINFKGWKASFLSMRQHVMRHYRERYGNWPPRAKSKKNDFEESGLNRIALQDLYNDFASVYDTLVDRQSLTTRASGDVSEPEVPSQDINHNCIRRILAEYDRSAIPVAPPIPYDVPNMPSLSPIKRDWNDLDSKKQNKEAAKKLAEDQINLLLMQSYNRDAMTANPFLVEFINFERRTARNKSLDELRDLRIGQWIFVYTVLQALPLLVVDAPGIQFSKGVEYFLCQIPLGSAPWMQESHSRQQSWYNIAGGTGFVSLPSHVVEHGAEGVYQRSHCWIEAKKWSGEAGGDVALSSESETAAQSQSRNGSLVPISPELPQGDGNTTFLSLESSMSPAVALSPALAVSPADDLRSRSPSPRRPGRKSISLGLEELPLPQGVVPEHARPLSTYNPQANFDDIIGKQPTNSEEEVRLTGRRKKSISGLINRPL